VARPRIDKDEIRNRLIDEAETALEESRGRRLVLSDLARRIGISQSYTHQFFPTKADLVRALALRWFADVERASRHAAEDDRAASQRLKAWVLSILQIKRDRYDRNPVLFDAYLNLASGHVDLVRTHTARLQGDLAKIVSDLVPQEKVEQAIHLVEDATLLFRTPHNISRHRLLATDERAEAVVDMLIVHLE
jgi:AcrR family transcriptional regulator